MLAFVDTSAWVAMANHADPDCDAVAAALRERGVRLVTSTFILDETITLVARRLGHDATLAVGHYLQSDEVELMPIEERDLADAWALFKARPDKPYSFTDCTSFALMRRLGIQNAIALDDDFRREGFATRP